MAKKNRTYRISDEAFDALRRMAGERDCTQGELIEELALGRVQVARVVTASPMAVETRNNPPPVSLIAPGVNQASAKPALPSGVVWGSQLTDRSQAKPLTRSVQLHQAE